jgi:hypothetical protein
MDVRQVHCFAETVGIVESYLLAILVEPIPFAVVIENGSENPPVAVEIGELRGSGRAAAVFQISQESQQLDFNIMRGEVLFCAWRFS